MNLTTTSIVRVALIGCGGMARWHIREMARQQDTTAMTVVCEPVEEEYQRSLSPTSKTCDGQPVRCQ